MSDVPSAQSYTENREKAIRRVWEMAMEACDGDEDRAARFLAAAFAVALEKSVAATEIAEEETHATL